MTKKKNTKEQSPCPLCAIDISGSGIRMMAAEQNPDGTLHILGEETYYKRGLVEQGVIVQKTEVANIISRLLKLLGNRIGIKQPIDSVFLPIGGKLLQFRQVSVKRDLVSKNYISNTLLKAMLGECKTKIEDRYTSMAVLNAEPYKYLLDGVEQTEQPTDKQKAKFIEIVYDVFVGKIELRDNVIGSLSRANISIEQQWVRPDAMLTALADDYDMQRGCAIIDFCATTTTLSIYKGDHFLHTSVSPLGEHDINLHIIQKTNLSYDTTERLKNEYACAAPQFVENDKTLAVRASNGQVLKIKTSILSSIVKQKLDETLEPLMQVIKQYEGKISTIYITGEACKLQGLQDYLQTLTTIPVEYGTHAMWLEETAEEDYYDPQNAALVGTLALAAQYRKDFPGEPPIHTPPFKKIWEKIENTVIPMFTDETIQ